MATTTTANGLSAVRRLPLGQGRWLWAVVAILALLPIIGGKTGLISNYGFLQLSLMIVYAIAVLGLNILTGFNGQISLGHGAFFAVGAYTSAVLMFWIARNLLDSRTGRAMMAIRDHSMAASTMGINVAHYKTVVFGISALYTGVAGALHAIIFEFVSPDSFRFELSIAILVGAVVGGIASLPGAVIGGVFVQVIEKYADALTKKITAAVNLPLDLEPWTIYGIALIVLMYTMPMGIAGGLALLWRRLKRS